jgi:hypothetical protein
MKDVSVWPNMNQQHDRTHGCGAGEKMLGLNYGEGVVVRGVAHDIALVHDRTTTDDRIKGS